MPELPEVETIRRGIEKPLINAHCKKVIIRAPKLRWPIPQHLTSTLPGCKIESVSRRSKYLLLTTNTGTLIIHLGMSGVLRLHQTLPKAEKHDHVDIQFDQVSLRYTDPRRFGAILWHEGDLSSHPLLNSLGPEPLSAKLNPENLAKQLHNRNAAIKTCIMNSKIVVGVGNIYAAEALFLSGIHPERPAKSLDLAELSKLCKMIKATLKKAIKAGGTTLKDFQTSEGKPGYFKQQLNVYGRENKPCTVCNTTLEKITIGQRSTVFCPSCQS